MAEANKSDRKGPGRPSLFKPEMVRIAQKAYELGATDLEVADMLGVEERTLHRWKISKEDFAAVAKAGKVGADDRVELSLYRRAMGYTFESEKIVTVGGEVHRVPIIEHVPPDTTAMIFWLKNRRRQEWRDVRQLGSDPENPLPGAAESEETVKRLAQKLRAMKLVDPPAETPPEGGDLL